MLGILVHLIYILHRSDSVSYASFVNREVAKWLEQQREGDKEGLNRNKYEQFGIR